MIAMRRLSSRDFIPATFSRLHKTSYHCESMRSIVDAAMRSDDITPAQAEQIKAKVRPMMGYLGRLMKRIHKRRFPHDDQLFITVVKAYDAIHELNVHLHYLMREWCWASAAEEGFQRLSA